MQVQHSSCFSLVTCPILVPFLILSIVKDTGSSQIIHIQVNLFIESSKLINWCVYNLILFFFKASDIVELQFFSKIKWLPVYSKLDR